MDVLLRLDGRNSHSFLFSSFLFCSEKVLRHFFDTTSQKSKRTTQTNILQSIMASRIVSLVRIFNRSGQVCVACMPSVGGCLKKGGMGIYYPATCSRIQLLLSYCSSSFFLALLLLLRRVLDHVVTCSQSDVFVLAQ